MKKPFVKVVLATSLLAGGYVACETPSSSKDPVCTQKAGSLALGAELAARRGDQENALSLASQAAVLEDRQEVSCLNNFWYARTTPILAEPEDAVTAIAAIATFRTTPSEHSSTAAQHAVDAIDEDWVRFGYQDDLDYAYLLAALKAASKHDDIDASQYVSQMDNEGVWRREIARDLVTQAIEAAR